ncbi:DMT family transporter [Rhodoferax sp.]|uniref:DMT family transporter n=1 Tax=Rhodoferax sp. TaxID=50421 RepID=UPI0025F92994|nr:DMT family transporter [Rhodoferax sp.]
MGKQLMLGVVAAIFAAFAWSLGFIAPYVIGPYSIYDLAVCRFLISGVFALGILLAAPSQLRGLTAMDWLVAAWLGLIGYVGYFLTIAAAVIYAGPVIPPAFVATVPVVLAIIGNFGPDRISWRSLAPPLALALAGLLLVNAEGLTHPSDTPLGHTLLGIVFSIAAVALWTLFGISNQAALRKRPHMGALTWTGLMMVGGTFEVVAFIPLGLSLDLFHVPRIGLAWATAAPLFMSALALAILGSIGASWAWSIATRRLPIGLAGQLIVTETIFATTFGLIARQRWPSVSEACGITLLLVGVIAAVGAFHRAQQPTAKLGGKQQPA